MDTAFLLMLIMVLFAATVLFIYLAIYFIPVIVAYIRKHNNTIAIGILTLFLGWTFLGWLAALLWSLNSDVSDQED